MRNFLKALYLLGAMPAEMYGEVYYKEKEKTHVYGPSRDDVGEEQVFVHDMLIDAYWFRVKTAKPKANGETERTVRLPKKNEPWAKDLYDYFKKQKGEKVFPFMRQDMLPKVKNVEVFRDLKGFRMSDLRFVRHKELAEKYEFLDEDFKEYGSVMITRTRFNKQRKDSQNETYNPDGWKGYFWKLYNPKLKEETKEKLKVDEIELKSPFLGIKWKKKKEQP
jgi:hypothetical protein